MDPVVIDGTKMLESILLGTALIGFAGLNRGGLVFDQERGVHVTSKTSLSRKIQKHFPAYRKISTSIDHICAGAGFTLIAYGTVSAFQSIFPMSNEDINNYTRIGVAGYVAWHLLYEALTTYRRKVMGKKMELNDFTQIAIDIIAPLTTYYFLSK